MNRLWIVTGGCLSALLLIGVGHQYLSEENKEPPKQVALATAKSAGGGESVAQEPPALSRAEAFAKLLELAQNGPVTPDLAEGLRKNGGKKAIEPLLSLMRSTTDFKTVGACVVALQDYRDPGLFHDMLARLDEIGVLDDPGKLPWFSKRLFGDYLKSATEPQLGLRAIRTRPSLYETGAELVTASLQSPDAETRKLASEVLNKVNTAKAPVEHKP